MRLLAGILCASTALRVCASHTEALIYTSDSDTRQSSGQKPLISPSTARLLLTQRLGLGQFHDLGDADESALDILNKYGGKQQDVFAQEEGSIDNNKLLLIVEGVEHPEDVAGSEDFHTVSITEPPLASDNRQLALNLLQQDWNLKNGRHDTCSLQTPQRMKTISGGIAISRSVTIWHRSTSTIMLTELSKPSESCSLRKDSFRTLDHKSSIAAFAESYEVPNIFEYSSTSIFHITSLQGLTRKDGSLYTTALSDIQTLRRKHSQTPNLETTLILTPPPTTRKRAPSSYGTYKTPRSRPSPEEEPLEDPPSPSPSSPAHPPPTKNNTNPLPHGILPLCHPNLASCIAATNNCSAHGTPYKKSSGSIDCFACRCGKTSTTNAEGKIKTVFWGGPACQKKDVSMPFWLLAGVTIALVAVSAWGVGLLVGVGGEELPSVIGAGVAGPRASK